MVWPFKLKKTFTSTFSAHDVVEIVERMISTKSKFLFFSYKVCVGSINGNTFTLGTHMGDPFGLFSSKIKGTIRSENPTIIDTRIVVPYSLIIFYLFVQMFSLPIIFSADEMTVNGVARVPDVYDRIGVALLMIFIPAIVIFSVTIWPIRKVEAHLILVLKMKEKHSANGEAVPDETAS